MQARLDLALTQRLAKSFPNGEDWNTINTRVFVADRGDDLFSDWSSTSHLKGIGGVYAVLLPIIWFDPTVTVALHPPHNHPEDFISFEFSLPLLADGYGVVYVGRTTDLSRRVRLHLTEGQRKNGAQVKFGLIDCKLHANSKDALRALREHGKFCYTLLPGAENCANRDVLEMGLCARFGPPFNIKSER